MTRVKEDRNGCDGDAWRMVGVNQTDEDKRSDHASTAIPRPLPKN